MKWLYIGLSIVFLILAIVMVVRPKEPLQILSVPTIYSFTYTDSLESVSIDVATTNPAHYVFDTTYIERAIISGEKAQMAFDVNDIIVGNRVELDGKKWTLLRIQLKPKIQATGSVFSIPEATLTLSYSNGKTVQIPIGEFNYLFEQDDPPYLAMGSVFATYMKVGSVETVSGLYLELSNTTLGLIDVIDIDVVSHRVSTNLPLVKRDTSCSSEETMERCLDMVEYNAFLPKTDSSFHETLMPKQNMTLLIPFLYQDMMSLHRFGVQITYRYNNQEYTMVIDDFPYLRTSLLLKAEQEEYYVSTIN